MIFAKKRIRGIAINHPISKLVPSKISEERLAILVNRLRANQATKAERDEIILGHIRLAIQIAGRYARLAPQKADVLVSESIYGVVYAVDKIVEKTEGEIVGAWIVSCCHRFLTAFLLKDSLIPKKWLGHLKKNDDAVNVIVNLCDVKAYGAKNFLVPRLIDIKELVAKSTNSELDEKVIKLREQGYNNREIAEQLGYAEKYIAKVRDKIRSRFEKLESV